MTAFIVLGVSGVGKSTIGALAAERLCLPFIEADDYHPASNVQKMSSGVALTDADRAPWIDRLSAAINAIQEPHVIVACSALTQFVRDRLRARIARPVQFIYLSAPAATIQQRLDQRPRHFMKPGMLATQLATLQPPKNSIVIDAGQPLETVASAVVQEIRGAIV